MQYLRQSTASQEVLLGPFVDDTDGKTAETGLTIANTDIKLWVEGGTSEASKNSGGATHIASGRYYAVLDATDTATCGKLTINVAVAGALPVQARFMVVPAMIYDSLFLGTDRLDTNVTHIGDTSQTARDIGASVLLSSGTGTGQLDFTSGVVKANVTQFGGSAGTFSGGRPEVNATHWKGTILATPDTGGYPKVTVKGGSGAGEINLTGGSVDAVITVGTVNGLNAGAIGENTIAGLEIARIQSGLATSSALTSVSDKIDAVDDYVDTEVAAIKAKTDNLPASFPTNFSSLSIDSSGRVKTLDVLATGTAQAGDVNTITLASGASSVNDFYKGALLIATGGTGAGQGKLITGYVGSTKVATVDGTWPVTPDNTTTYAALGSNFSVGLYNTVVTNLDAQTSALATQTSVDDVYSDTQSVVAKLPGRAFLAGTDNVSGSIQSDDVASIQSGLASQTSVDDIPTNSEFSTALADIKGATFDTSTDSLEALRNRGDAAWVTGADVYAAQIEYTVDGANTRDEYTATWFKNGVRQTSGITSPVIQVAKRADGTDLIASTAMSAIGSTGSLKYDTTTEGARLTAGESAIVIVTATIDGSSRTWSRLVSRDSAAAE